MQNPKNEGHYLSITTKICVETINPSMSTIIKLRNDSVKVYKASKDELGKLKSVDLSAEKDKDKEKVD